MDIDFYKLSQNYFQGRITDREEKLLHQFLKESEQNRALFQQWEAEWRNNAREQASAKTKAAWERMAAQMQTEAKANSSAVRRKRGLYYAAAAVGLLLIGCALWLFLPKAPVKPFMAETAPHEQKAFTLPDGTQVTLNGSSTLTCAADYGQRDRNITFDGEGVFDVQKDAAKPFIIHIGDYSVTVLGTQFNLSAYKEDGAYTLALIKGSVKIKYRQDSVMVQPNEQVRFDKQTATFLKEPIKAALADAWTEGRLAFENIPLQDLANKLERLYDVRITFVNPQIAQERVYISICTDEPFDDVCAALEALLPIVIQGQNSDYLISNQ